MKKSKLALATASLILATGMLGGCGDDEAEVTVSKVSFSGLAVSYKKTDTVDWSEFKVTVAYSDSSAVTFSSDKMEFDVDTPVKSETELLVKTQGLYTMEAGALVEKRYEISVALKADFKKFYSAGSVAVGEIIREKYDLVEYSIPRSIETLKDIKAHAGENSEGAFKKFNDDFIVGTLNPWKFEPVATFLSKANPSEIDDFTNYEKDVKLYVVEGATETEVSSAAYERILLADGSYQFAKEDAGKRFKISIAPKDFAKDMNDDPVSPVTFEFNVQEGLNIYNAKQLGALNLTSLKSEEFVGDKAYISHYRKASASYEESSNGQGNVFLVNPSTSTYGYIDAPRVWQKFLIDNGVFTEETIENFMDIKGVFLQSDINITPSDIPSEFFVNQYDPTNYFYGGINTGAPRDDASIYAPTTMNELTISGNYFTLDSSAIPLCKNTSDGAASDVSGFPLTCFSSDYNGQIPPGHANLFEICGVDPANTDTFYTNQVYPESVKPAVIKNIKTRGNTGADISDATDLDKKMKVTGLIFAKSSYAQTTMENIIVQEYMIGMFGDHGLGQAVGAKEQTCHSFVKDSKVFDCSNSGVFNYRDGGLMVSNTVMKRFGGACIINAGISGDATVAKKQPNTLFTSDCEFENYVSGGEVYYSAVGASGYIAQIQAYDQLFALSQKKLVGPAGDPHAGKMNVIALQMDGDGYVFAGNGKYYGSIVLNSDSANSKLELSLADNVTTRPLNASCKTEVATDQPFVLNPEDPSSAMGPAAITGDLLNMDICLGATYLSVIFDLF